MSVETDQIRADVEALQAASAAAADQISDLTDQVLALQAGDISDAQLAALHEALAAVTSELVTAVEDSQAALGGTGDTSSDDDEQRRG